MLNLKTFHAIPQVGSINSYFQVSFHSPKMLVLQEYQLAETHPCAKSTNPPFHLYSDIPKDVDTLAKL